ncbi:calcium-binding protein [Roseovarius faecimaris]|uniref:Calcium-binding protein n=1 Tax=Roseovarius faecimaris TaxID=2494550 RepID=A0A6I6ITV8_9RHOB|nr:EF-hand domain-containing protein [Roseovarius faecimaris]QGX98927.1 calcium-binding protein [Roseovarius faecimaris]
MQHSVLLTTLAISIAAGGALSAGDGTGPGKHRPQHSFEELDANSDGMITQAEMEAHMQARFSRQDANGDGLLSEDEMRSFMQEKANKRIEKRISHMMKRHDANGDGQLAMDEMKDGRMGMMMSRVDTDGDGAISKEEFESMQMMRGKHRGMNNDG